MNKHEYDIIVIGGGATGLGVALEAQSRGYKTLLLEAYDFGKGTSSKSTKLVHGGIRYLANLDFALVKEGLHERYYFLQNAPHLAKPQTYLVPFYSWMDKLKYFIGIKLYDFLSGKQKIGKSKFLSKTQVLEYHNAPDLVSQNLIGGAVYNDGQFDDTRLLISILRTFLQLGGCAFNYAEVKQILKDKNHKACGVRVLNTFTNNSTEYLANVVINATGVLTDRLLNIDEPQKNHHNVTAAQGTHLVFEKNIFNSPHALVIPKTIDNRILFVLPWLDKIIVGTTDIIVDKPTIEPIASNNEVDFIIETLQQYTKHAVSRSDIKAKFAGLRPLVTPDNNSSTAKISRKHEILQSRSNLISIVGGKWTIYRLMGEDTINYIIDKNLIEPKGKSITKTLHLFGYIIDNTQYPLKAYGCDYNKILDIQQELENFDKLHNNLPYYQAEVIYHVRYEMAKTVEDVLARRTRALYLDAKASIECAETVAKLMANELKFDNNWILLQVFEFGNYANNYLA
ncbi:MAG: glycerol-3-phosphate dehydrogenase/oxidase [Burkholderiales bacterium]|nr:glycerol-3-phosphate dehydrogenase/oxidase [Burkholderiales bacterium]